MSVVALITKPCSYCGQTGMIDVTEGQLLRYVSGEYVQNVFPEMHKAYREQIISGIHPGCWDEMFGESDCD